MRADIATKEQIVAMAAEAAFGRPLVTNVQRAILVEAIISATLPASWKWCASDYAAFDFQHEDGTRLEVKQTASQQSWATTKPSLPKWDIAPRTGFWEGASWTARPGRNADIYVLASHPVVGAEADHRDPWQWRFAVVQAAALPHAKSISASRVKLLAQNIGVDRLCAEVEEKRLTWRDFTPPLLGPSGEPCQAASTV